MTLLSHLVVLGLALVALPAQQPSGTQNRAAFKSPSLEELTAAVGSREAAAPAIKDALAAFIQDREARSMKSPIRVLSRQIPADWIPEGAKFERLAIEDAEAHFGKCGRLLWVWSAERKTDTLTVTIAEGDQCGNTGRSMRYDQTPEG